MLLCFFSRPYSTVFSFFHFMVIFKKHDSYIFNQLFFTSSFGSFPFPIPSLLPFSSLFSCFIFYFHFRDNIKKHDTCILNQLFFASSFAVFLFIIFALLIFFSSLLFISISQEPLRSTTLLYVQPVTSYFAFFNFPIPSFPHFTVLSFISIS